MAAFRLLAGSVVLSALAAAQIPVSAVEKAAQRLTEQAAKAPADLRIEFQLSGAKALASKYPELAREMLDPVLSEIRAGKVSKLSWDAAESLAAASPEGAISVLRWLPRGSADPLINALLHSRHLAEAVVVFRDALAHGELPLADASLVMKHLVDEDAAEAAKLFAQILIVFPEDPEPISAWNMIPCAEAMQNADPTLAATVYERILRAAADPAYGEGKPSVTAGFTGFQTHDSRETLLVAAGSRLRAIAPEKAQAFQKQLSGWDLSKPAVAQSWTFGGAANRPAISPEIAALDKRIGELRTINEAERTKHIVELAVTIDDLPTSEQKLNLARWLVTVSTQGDVSQEAVAALAATLAHALHRNSGLMADYVTLAGLVGNQGAPAPALVDPAGGAADALLALRDEIRLNVGFTLTALDGKTWDFASLRGKVVMLNFWATWCGPCRQEMPDMEKIWRRHADQGLIVLAVSDEDRDAVATFIQKQGYTFPVLLDPRRKVHGDFDVVGIPRTFIFDREGHLTAQVVDVRTEAQFLDLLRQAGM